jgi:hypothetical protein
VRVQAHSDPASDPSGFTYRLLPPPPMAPIEFTLRDGEERDNGPFEGTVTVEALSVVGWVVGDIQCVGPSPAAFSIDIPAGTVTMQHGLKDEQICSFTHRRQPSSQAPDTEPPATEGIAASPRAAELGSVVLPRRPALLNVRGGRGFVVVRVRLPRRAVLKAQLLWRGRLLATSRVVRPAGIHDLTPRLDSSTRSTLRRRGLRHITVTLRVVAVERPGKTYVMWYRVRVRVP